MRQPVIATLVSLAALFASAQTDPHAGHAGRMSPTAAPAVSAAPAPAAARDEALPPAEESAKAALEKSPRHGEYVDVKTASGPVRVWVVYPERKDKAGVVIVIHEIYGLSDWIRGMADQLAREGFIAVAPDLVTGKGPGGGGTDSVSSRDDVVKLIRGLTSEEVTARLNDVREWAIKLPAATARAPRSVSAGEGERASPMRPRSQS